MKGFCYGGQIPYKTNAGGRTGYITQEQPIPNQPLMSVVVFENFFFWLSLQ